MNPLLRVEPKQHDFTDLLVLSYSTNNSANLPVDVATLVFQKVTV
jgi:hypothetical protein